MSVTEVKFEVIVNEDHTVWVNWSSTKLASGYPLQQAAYYGPYESEAEAHKVANFLDKAILSLIIERKYYWLPERIDAKSLK